MKVTITVTSEKNGCVVEQICYPRAIQGVEYEIVKTRAHGPDGPGPWFTMGIFDGSAS